MRDHDSAFRQQKYRMADWLRCHSLTRAFCRKLLETVEHGKAPEGAEATREEPVWKSLSCMWFDTARVFEVLLPDYRAQIRHVERSTRVRTRINSRLDYAGATIRKREHRAACVILFNYAGDRRSQLTVAHEFCHVLHDSFHENAFVPPIHRELCAFLAERLFARYLTCSDDALSFGYDDILKADSRRYVQVHDAELREALDGSDAPYRYGWNYPIARRLAFALPANAETLESVLIRQHALATLIGRYPPSKLSA